MNIVLAYVKKMGSYTNKQDIASAVMEGRAQGGQLISHM